MSIGRLEVSFDERHRELAARVAAFARERIEPIEADHVDGDDEDEAARRYVEEMASVGLLDHAVPRGGARFDSRALCLIRENLARASGFADCMFAMQGLGSAPITLAGDDEQRAAYQDGVASGERICAFALTEPEAGSDVASMTTRAIRSGDEYVLDGTKTFISNAGVANLYTVFAKTDPDAGHRGISAFVVDGANPGLHVVERQRVIAPHPIGTIRFDGCRVPASRRVGGEGEGFRVAMRTLDVFRPTVGAAALGLARRALHEARERARSRRQFGRAIADFQLIQAHLAAMATELDAARLLVYRAAHLADRGDDRTTLEAAMAKLFATETAQRVVDRAVQIFGGSGVLRGNVVERLYREVRALRIYEGTSEVQHLVIASRLLKEDGPDY